MGEEKGDLLLVVERRPDSTCTRLLERRLIDLSVSLVSDFVSDFCCTVLRGLQFKGQHYGYLNLLLLPPFLLSFSTFSPLSLPPHQSIILQVSLFLPLLPFAYLPVHLPSS